MNEFYDQLFTKEEGYSVYSEFDLKKHKEKYINYLEVIIDKDGTVHYAVPSHMEKLIRMACEQLQVTREGLNKKVPKKYYCDMLPWLCMVTGALSVWTNGIEYYSITEKHYETLLKLQEADLYKGILPNKADIPFAKTPLYPAKDHCLSCRSFLNSSQSCKNSNYLNYPARLCRTRILKDQNLTF